MSFAQFKHLAGGSAGYYPVATDEKGKLARRTAEEMRGLIGASPSTHTHTVASLSNLGSNWASLLTSVKPSTLAGYGITDAQAALGYTPVSKDGDALSSSFLFRHPWDGTNAWKPAIIFDCEGPDISGGEGTIGFANGTTLMGLAMPRKSELEVATYSSWDGIKSGLARFGCDENNNYIDVTSIGKPGAFRVNGQQVLTSRQTGMGATLPAATIGGTYNSTVQSQIQALYDKIILLETKLKAHGLIAN